MRLNYYKPKMSLKQKVKGTYLKKNKLTLLVAMDVNNFFYFDVQGIFPKDTVE